MCVYCKSHLVFGYFIYVFEQTNIISPAISTRVKFNIEDFIKTNNLIKICGFIFRVIHN